MYLAQPAHARNAEIPTAVYIRAVMMDARLPRSSKLLASTLASFGDGKPCILPASELGRLCGFGKDALIPARRLLEERGYLVLERDSRNTIVLYTLALPVKAGGRS